MSIYSSNVWSHRCSVQAWSHGSKKLGQELQANFETMSAPVDQFKVWAAPVIQPRTTTWSRASRGSRDSTVRVQCCLMYFVPVDWSLLPVNTLPAIRCLWFDFDFVHLWMDWRWLKPFRCRISFSTMLRAGIGQHVSNAWQWQNSPSFFSSFL